MYSRYQVDEIKCIKCDDSNVKSEYAETADVFGYDTKAPRPDAYIKKGKQ